MYLTMNRFKVASGREADFEHVWASRDSHLASVEGFKSFHLMKGPEGDGFTLYASHTAWETEDHFKAWTKSEAFRAAHKGAGGHSDLYLEGPKLEIFETVQKIES